MNNKFSSLVKRGVELDFQIKEMQKELDNIKQTLKQEFVDTGCKLFMSADGEACATVTAKAKTTIDPADFAHVMAECGQADKVWDCVTVQRTKALRYLDNDTLEECTTKDPNPVLSISFSAAK